MNCPIPAKLFLGDQEIANGEAIVEESDGRGLFWPQIQIAQDKFPDRETKLKLSDKPDAIPLKGFHRCTAISLTLHYHFQT
jgi:hypothetical protein